MSDASRKSSDRPQIDKDTFGRLVQEQLAPLFSGTVVHSINVTKKPRRATVAFKRRDELIVNPKGAKYYVVLKRSQTFAPVSSAFISEHKVAAAFIDVVAEIQEAIGKDYEQELLLTVKRRIAAKAVRFDALSERTILSAIDQLDAWSSRLYEGQPISASLGFEPGDAACSFLHKDVWKEDFSAVLTNGFDTLIACDYAGAICRYESLTYISQGSPHVPLRLGSIAEWTADNTGRVALVLNRIGEILVVRDGRLVFARRGGIWHFLASEPVVKQMVCPKKEEVRKAVLASCLDASFARTGACIGVVRSRHENTMIRELIKAKDSIDKSDSLKARFFKEVIEGKTFQQLDRRKRQELLAVDGATIINFEGRILAVGAILDIRGGSTGGGRTAAAKKLSNYGTGIKVSEDGYVEAYYRRGPGKDLKVAFSLMKSE